MPFSHDTELALVSAAAFVNTIEGGTERLPDRAALDRFLDEERVSGVREGTEEELRAVRDLRLRLRALWDAATEPADEDRLVALVNRLLAEADASPRLVRHDGWDWHLHLTPPDAPLVDRLATEAAMAVADLVRSQDLDRLRTCSRHDCDNVFIDLSRNRSRRFCDQICANRAHVAAYRARQAEDD